MHFPASAGHAQERDQMLAEGPSGPNPVESGTFALGVTTAATYHHGPGGDRWDAVLTTGASGGPRLPPDGDGRCLRLVGTGQCPWREGDRALVTVRRQDIPPGPDR